MAVALALVAAGVGVWWFLGNGDDIPGDEVFLSAFGPSKDNDYRPGYDLVFVVADRDSGASSGQGTTYKVPAEAAIKVYARPMLSGEEGTLLFTRSMSIAEHSYEEHSTKAINEYWETTETSDGKPLYGSDVRYEVNTHVDSIQFRCSFEEPYLEYGFEVTLTFEDGSTRTSEREFDTYWCR